METLLHCPICQSADLKPLLECMDYTVSHKTFAIVECAGCGFRFTNPRPPEAEAGSYYESEDYVSHSATKRGIINKAYHIVRRFTLNRKLKLINHITHLQKGRLLDLGCGTGEFIALCRDKGWEVKGMEPSPSAREFAKSHYQLELSGAGSWNELSDDSRDVITAWHVLEHIYMLEDTVAQLKRVLAPKGTLVIALPNCSSADAQFYGNYWAAYDVPRHIWHFKPKDVKSYFENRGFMLQAVLPMPLDAYYICMLSEKYKNGSTNYGRALIHGWTSNRKAKKEANTWSSQIYVFNKG